MNKIIDKKIHKNISLNCSLDHLWWQWTTHEGLLSFFGRDNKIELKIGGAYEIYFLLDEAEGSRGGEGNQILSYLPQQMLSFSWNAPPQQAYIRNHEHKTWVVVQMKQLSEGECYLTLDHYGWLEGEKWDETYQYFEQAWDFVMQQLKESHQS